MSDARQKALHFLENERQFRLGALPTEQSHPITKDLSTVIQADLTAGIRLLQQVDRDVVPVAERVLAGDAFRRLVDALHDAIVSGRRVFFTGCGATGRLAILLEAAWRRFWQDLRRSRPEAAAKLTELEDSVVSVMSGGDYALIRSVEGFEDFPEFGKRQLTEAGVRDGDVVVAITEGGETSFVIGTAWRGVEAGASVFFVFNNPADVLREHVERSRQVIDDDRITKLDLASGPMAVAGSTRMQATTSELLVVGAALEIALMRLLGEYLSDARLADLGLVSRSPEDFTHLFAALLEDLAGDDSIDAVARAVAFEHGVYSAPGLVTYLADGYLLDILTDTTERAPTFSLPPFRKSDDNVSPPSWAFAKNPLLPTPQAWDALLRRSPRCIEWNADVYRTMNAPASLQANPPRLDRRELLEFAIGLEDNPSRYGTKDAALTMLLVGAEVQRIADGTHPFLRAFAERAERFQKTAAISVGPRPPQVPVGELFAVRCELPASGLKLWDHLAVKLVLNTLSTATMAVQGRIRGNWMIYAEATNKKLIDRATRLVSELTGLSYEDACIALHETLEEIAARHTVGQHRPSPTALAIERVGPPSAGPGRRK
ncbi:MAG: sugar phosphate isomerase [Phycisphaerae bacterium]|nr:sugar phosphate isomerase [Phycisphaerae bacterium]